MHYAHSFWLPFKQGLLHSAIERATSKNTHALRSHTLLRQQQRRTQHFLREDGHPQTSSAMDPWVLFSRVKTSAKSVRWASCVQMRPFILVGGASVHNSTRKSRVQLGRGQNDLHVDWREILPDLINRFKTCLRLY